LWPLFVILYFLRIYLLFCDFFFCKTRYSAKRPTNLKSPIPPFTCGVQLTLVLKLLYSYLFNFSKQTNYRMKGFNYGNCLLAQYQYKHDNTQHSYNPWMNNVQHCFILSPPMYCMQAVDSNVVCCVVGH